MQLAIVSDTHIPGRESAIPEWVQERLRNADHVIHAGDFEAVETLETVEELAGGASNLTAVRGNIYRPGLPLRDVETLDVEGVRFVVVHGTGPHDTWEERVVGLVREEAGNTAGVRRVVGVAGHTHVPTDVTVDGIRLLNPGTATGARPGTATTMLTATVDDERVDVTFHEDEGDGE